MLNLLIPFKRGDTFVLNATYMLNGVASDIAGIRISCTLRQKDGTDIADLTFKAASGTGLYTLTGDGTDKWPLGRLYGDVRYDTNTTTYHDDMFIVEVSDFIT